MSFKHHITIRRTMCATPHLCHAVFDNKLFYVIFHIIAWMHNTRTPTLYTYYIICRSLEYKEYLYTHFLQHYFYLKNFNVYIKKKMQNFLYQKG